MTDTKTRGKSSSREQQQHQHQYQQHQHQHQHQQQHYQRQQQQQQQEREKQDTIFAQYLNPNKNDATPAAEVTAESEVTVAYEVYGRCAQRFAESWKVGDPDIKFGKAQENNNNNSNNNNSNNNNQFSMDDDYPINVSGVGESRHDRDIIDFIKEIMSEEHTVKSDMIEMLKQQIVVLKDELGRKQSIIEKLLKVPRPPPCNICANETNEASVPKPSPPNITLRCCNSQLG